jgi:translation elongation factor EF-Tu-like GTPase
MMLLFHVQDTFEIQGRGLVVATDCAIGDCDFRLKLGDEIEIRNELRPWLRTRITGIEFADPYSPVRPFAFLLPREVYKGDVEVGAEVWQVEAHGK